MGAGKEWDALLFPNNLPMASRFFFFFFAVCLDASQQITVTESKLEVPLGVIYSNTVILHMRALSPTKSTVLASWGRHNELHQCDGLWPPKCILLHLWRLDAQSTYLWGRALCWDSGGNPSTPFPVSRGFHLFLASGIIPPISASIFLLLLSLCFLPFCLLLGHMSLDLGPAQNPGWRHYETLNCICRGLFSK